jgi:hypothetical protein
MGKNDVPTRILHDAVVVVPGIMGSALRDAESGHRVWGVRKLFEYSARMHADRLRSLAVTADERAGHSGRIQPDGILNIAEWLPGLGGAQPYNDLVSQLRQSSLNRNCVLAFAYDWRLSVEHNGVLLAKAAHEHLGLWRQHPAYLRYRDSHPEAGAGGLIFVAHSMGGLIVRELLRLPGAEEIRAVLTVGTPFGGSVKAAVMLNSGEGGPLLLPASILRDVVRTMPGLYDLLPSYRALMEGPDMRVPEVEDIVALGGRRDLAEESVRWRNSRRDLDLPGHSMMVGAGQRTAQSYRIEAGRAIAQEFMFVRGGDDRLLLDEDGRPRQENRQGDGTVYQFAAHLPGTQVREIPVFQPHTNLARSRAVIDMARGMLRGLRHPDELGTMLGDGRFGLEVPDWVEPGAPFTIRVTGADPADDVECVLEEVSGLDHVVGSRAGQPSGAGRDLLAGSAGTLRGAGERGSRADKPATTRRKCGA